MNGLIINEKFKDLLPALSEEEYNQLEESILSEGVRESVKLWRNQIIDGHNRHSICEKHNLDFPVFDMVFADEDEVLEWIYINQLGRRNLTGNQKTLYIGELYQLRKKRHGGDRGNQYTKPNDNLAIRQNVGLPNLEDKNGSENTKETAPKPEDFSNTEIESFDAQTAADLEAINTERTENLAAVEAMNAENLQNIVAAEDLKIEYDEGFKPKPPPPIKKETETAQKIAKDFGVSPRTVERAAAVAKAVEVLPEKEKKDFVAGRISQKAVIEKAKEITAPKPPPAAKPPTSETDIFTETAAAHGRKLHSLIADLQAAITRANNDFAKHKQDFDHYGDIRRVSLDPLNEMEWKTRLLKSLKKCANCQAQKGGCQWCKNTGYQNKSNYSTTKSALNK